MKDFLMFQALLLAVFITAFGFPTRTLAHKEEHIYEEPDMDHIHEGLAIEACGGDLYEEIPVYTQLEGAEAP
ncbi:unnamed protein product [Knipowitschia caucasica]|uniref:Secreted protein n=1 Tax=Knipowitschia caucasica TaxID=637954 RepID=A0AAV2LC70_KNICA